MHKYQILEVIGDGTYGVVYKGINTETNEQVAIKKLKNKVSSWNECMELKEVNVLKRLQHENIIKLHEVIREQNNDVSLIFEYADMSLFEYIDSYRKNKSYIPESKIKSIIYQIIKGVKYLHDNGIMHRDLKPENILVIKSSNLVKICDFGTAREFIKNNTERFEFTDYVCTRWYRAPECVLKSTNYDEYSDIWAIGCILAEMYLLKPIFPGNDEFDQLNKICNILGTPNYPEWPDGFRLIQSLGMKFPICNRRDLSSIVPNACSDSINLMNIIFTWDPCRRASTIKLLEHRFFSEYNGRPGTFSFPNRKEAKSNSCYFKDNFKGFSINQNYKMNRDNLKASWENNKNLWGNLNSSLGTYNRNNSSSNYSNDLNDVSKNDNGFTRNFNFDIKKARGCLPNINSFFNKDEYVSNVNNVVISNRNHNTNLNSPRGLPHISGFFNSNTINDKNKFQLMAENNIFDKKKFGKQNYFNKYTGTSFGYGNNNGHKMKGNGGGYGFFTNGDSNNYSSKSKYNKINYNFDYYS